MKRTALLLVLLCQLSSLNVVAQNPTSSDAQKPASPNKPWITERNQCKAFRIGDPKEEKCGITCDTGQLARCVSVALDSPTPPTCACLKAEGLEGVNAFSICRGVKKDAEGHEWESCSIACDKRTAATCGDAPMYPAPGSPTCRCEVKPSKKS